MADRYWKYRPLLDLLGKAEGTDRGRKYNETLAYGAYTGGPVNLVNMTLGEVDQLQTRMLRHPANRWNSSAVGRYQIVRTTLRSIKAQLRLNDNERYDEEMQDRMGCYLLGARGIDQYLDGKMSESILITNLAKEWASLPVYSANDGATKAYYGGQGGKISVGEVRRALNEVRHRHVTQKNRGVQTPPASPSSAPAENWFVALLRLLFAPDGRK